MSAPIPHFPGVGAFVGVGGREVRSAAVLDYRVYFIGRDGHFLRAIDIQIASDQDAIARAVELREGHEVEVWQRTRFVRWLSDPTSKL
jgi:hypothetical protein